MEKLLHYAWKHKMLPLRELRTTDGRSVELIDPGMHNSDQGPDFFNAKVRIGGTLWAGNVELHLRASDWHRHGHDKDPAYDSTILHVCQSVDAEAVTSDGRRPPQMQLDIPQGVRDNYEELCRTDDYPRCHRVIPRVEPLKAHAWMDALLAERMRERAQRVLDRVRLTGGDWERATFVTLSRNLGFGLNGDAFERWAMRIPPQAVGKHRDNLAQVEAIFLGQAGLLDEMERFAAAKAKRGGKAGDTSPGAGPHAAAADTTASLRQEYAFLAHKFSLPEPMDASEWKYLRTRPGNFPHVRLLQLASLYHGGGAGMSALLEADGERALHRCLGAAGMSAASRDLIAINTVAPLLYAYGESRQDERPMQRAVELLEGLPAEENRVMRQWRACGLTVDTAADSQALLQLKRGYCDKADCLRCRFGYEYLKTANR